MTRMPPNQKSKKPRGKSPGTHRKAAGAESDSRPLEGPSATSRGKRGARPRAKAAAPRLDPALWLGEVFEHSAVGIGRLDETSRVLDGNAAFEAFFGVAMHELRGRHLTDFSVAEEAEAIAKLVAEVDAGARNSAFAEVRFVRRDARLSWGALMVSRASGHSDVGLIAVVQDISERKALETKLLHQAFHDSLTDLPNRALFRDRVDHALARRSRDPGSVAVLFLDLDDFKAVNDTQGHAAGDRMLQRVAATLLGATRGCDTVSRLGGDEFAVLLEDVNMVDGPEVAAQRIVNALSRPMEMEPGRTVTARASIGIAVYTGSEETDELLRNADVAMYEAKMRSRGRWVAYNASMHAALVDKVSLETQLRGAIEECQYSDRPGLQSTGSYPRFAGDAKPEPQITLAYQPIVDVNSGALLGLEALLRWSHPERGEIPPATFVPVAEETGLILPLGRWVLRTACRQTCAWNARHPRSPVNVTVNLSGRQLQDEGLASDVEAALRESGLPAARLTLEITETVIMQESATTRQRLTELKRLGVRLAIDDFGTGFSSLSHLQQFPIDTLKIDRSFVERMHQGKNDAALLRTIIALAKLLSLRTVAEGVEDVQQQAQLRDLGCDSAQGFIFGRPMDVGAIDTLLASGILPHVAVAVGRTAESGQTS